MRFPALMLGSVLLLWFPQLSSAQVVQDQISVGDIRCSIATSNGYDYSLAQTFTVGISGSLDSVGLRVFTTNDNTQPLFATLFQLNPDGTPNLAAPLATTTISATSVISAYENVVSSNTTPALWPTADFSSSPLAFSAGDELAVVIGSVVGSTHGYGWFSTSAPTYLGGSAYITAGQMTPFSCGSLQFRTLMRVAGAATPVGSDISVTSYATLPDGSSTGVSLTFDGVTSSGETAVTTSSQGAPPPAGFKLTSPPVYYEISTTATFTGSVRVCLGWSEGQIANESTVQMFHHENNQWVDITDPTSRDSVNNSVCGTTTSFSPFTLFDVKYPFTGFFQPLDNIPTVNSIKAGAAVPVKFSLGGDLGLNIFASGHPKAQLMQCVTGETIASVEETVNAGSSSLSYDAQTAIYTYVWKTDKGWANSCRELQVKFTDGEVYTARFTLRK